MTVREMIEKLQKVENQDLTVSFVNFAAGEITEVREVAEVKDGIIIGKDLCDLGVDIIE